MLHMKQRARIYYTETDKALMLDRWQKGESLNSIARLFDRHHLAIQGVLARTGGIRPPARRRSRLALTMAERDFADDLGLMKQLGVIDLEEN